MKKLMALTLVLLLAVSVFGCQNQPANEPESEPTAAPANDGDTGEGDADVNDDMWEGVSGNYIVATQGVSGGSYTRVATFMDAAAKYMPDTVTMEQAPISSGGFAALVLVDSGEADISSSNNVPARRLYAGDYGEFSQMTNVVAIAGGTSDSYITIMFTDAFVQETGFTSFEEVVEAKYPIRLVTKAVGSFGEMGTGELLDCYGISYEDIESWGGTVTHVDPTQMADLLKEGQADVSIDTLSLGQASFTELCLTTTMHVIPLGEEVIAAMNEIGYPTDVIKGGSWGGNDEDVKTVSAVEVIVCRTDLPDAVAYAWAKALCEDMDEIAELVPAFAETFDPALAGDILYTGCPLHPGAEQYYREAGYLTD